MRNKIYVKPSKPAATIQIIIGALFLPFGIFLCSTAEGEARPFALGFMVIWIFACGAIIVYGLMVVFAKNSPAIIDIENLKLKDSEGGLDFETKLKKLESLRKEKLISESEYRQKRSEIMKEQW